MAAIRSIPAVCVYGLRMKPAPAPDVPGATPWERFDNAVRNVFNVSKEALLKEEAKQKQQRAKKRAKKKRAGKKSG